MDYKDMYIQDFELWNHQIDRHYLNPKHKYREVYLRL